MSECLFCNIVQGTEDSIKVYEDELCMAFMDIYPLSRGHVLVIPKSHSEKLEDQIQNVQDHLFRVSNGIIAAQRAASYGVGGTHFLINDGKQTNQHIPHVHLHLIPREPYDSLKFAYKIAKHFTGLFGFRTSQTTLEVIAKQIRNNLPVEIIGNSQLSALSSENKKASL